MLESAPKVTESILSDCILRGMGSNPAAVRVFAWASPRHPLLEAWVPKVT